MPRSISNDLKSHIAGSPTTLARLFLLTRSDDEQLALTDADSAITYESKTYLPIDGVGMTAIDSQVGAEPDNAEVTGFLSDSRITDEDLIAGRYDGAKLKVSVVNRRDLSMGDMVLFVGSIGEVSVTGNGQFKAELRPLSQRLRQHIGDVTSSTCRCARLGNAQCKLNMAGNAVGGQPVRRTGVSLTSVPSALELRWTDSAPSDFYSGGVVKITSGQNSGIERVIKSHTNSSGVAVATLRMPFPFAVNSGDVITVESGCDRTFATCKNKFANAKNFHGEPDLPGNDKVQKVGRTNGR